MHGINSAGPSNKMATGAKTSLPAGEGKKDAVSISLLCIL